MAEFKARKNNTLATIAEQSLKDAQLRRQAHDLVGKKVKFRRMPNHLRQLIKGETGTVKSVQGRNATVQVGHVVHNVNSAYLREIV